MHHIATSLTLAGLFAAAPMQVIPLLDESARLDLIDLYEANMPAQVTNRFNGMTEMIMLSDTLIALRLTEVSTLEMRLTADSIIELRHCIALPEHVCTEVHQYTPDWQELP